MNVFLNFQQSELDAVLMYEKLIEQAKTETERNILKSLKADEGKHAAILSKITGRTDLRPTDTMAKPVLAIKKIAGTPVTYIFLGIGERAAYYLYQPLIKSQPLLQYVAKDERRHGNVLFSLAKDAISTAKEHKEILT